MWELCHCSRRTLNVRDATYVFKARPCCSLACYNMAINDAERKERARRYGLVPLASPEQANGAA
jgi:hypothetical protein